MNQAAQDGCAEFISMMMRKVPHYNLEFTTKVSRLDVVVEFRI